MDFFLLLSFEYCLYTAATIAAPSNKKSDKHGKSNMCVRVCVCVCVCWHASVTDDNDTFLLEIIQIGFSVMQTASMEYVYYLLV